jgi:hypothetical protein
MVIVSHAEVFTDLRGDYVSWVERDEPGLFFRRCVPVDSDTARRLRADPGQLWRWIDGERSGMAAQRSGGGR